jgi:hypothetical protein
MLVEQFFGPKVMKISGYDLNGGGDFMFWGVRFQLFGAAER